MARETQESGSSVNSDAQINTDKQAGAEAEMPRTKPVSFTSGNMDIQYDRAVNAIKNADEEVKNYAARIKKLGGKTGPISARTSSTRRR